jgi:predicted alpha/beta-hydrolase family hydrolase
MPTTAPTPIVSISAVTLSAPYRGQDLEVRVSAPTTGTNLPIIVFGHGFALSSRNYEPLVDYWAARGFVVIQPTFLDSALIGLAPEDPRTPEIWRVRVRDVVTVVDSLAIIEEAVPGLAGRLDRSRIAAAGHSYGATTASMVLGARVRSADGEVGESMADPRFSVGLFFALAGDGDGLNEMATQHFPFMRPDFEQLTAPALIVAGDADQSMLSTRGPEWFTEGYELSPGPKSLLTLFGAEHSLGGITGYTDTHTTDENPARVELVRHTAWAFLLKELAGDSSVWDVAEAELAATSDPLGSLTSK